MSLGPERIIFGHDAKRGIQRYGKHSPNIGYSHCDDNVNSLADANGSENNELEGDDWAIGLDSGACYGGSLTGIILPQRELVSVKALRKYCPISKK